jgi:hypothetical protein
VAPEESDQKMGSPSKILISVRLFELIHNAHGTGSPDTAVRRNESHMRAWGAKYLIAMIIPYPFALHIIYPQTDRESDTA